MRLIVAAALLVAAEAFSPSFLATRGPAPARLKRSAWHMTATAPEPTEVLEAPAVERKSPKFTSTIFREPEVGASKNRAYVLDRELAGQKRDGRKTVIITGASGGIGLQAAKSLALDKDWHVILAVRSYSKALENALAEGMEPGTFTIMHLDLASLDSDKEPRITVDGYEEAVQVNHLGHFLLCNLLLGDLPEGSGRILFIGTETANDGLAGFVPPRADLGKLEGMARGMNYTIDGKEFEPTKSYKDSKVCNAVIMREMNKRFGQERGITVHAMFPGCIAESPLFRQKRGWFRKVFPEFQKKITKQFVPENIAGQRVADCVADADKAVGGAYWKWNAAAGQQANRDGFEKQKKAAANVVKIPAEALDEVLAEGIWDLSAALVGLGIAPSIKLEDNDALEPEERERKQKMELKSTFVREDMTRARGLLEQLRTAPEALADREFATELSDALSGDAAEGLDTVYYWGRRQHPPMIKIYDDETNYRMELSAPRARADPKVGEILLTGLRAALKDAGVNTEMSPEISFEGKIPEKDSDASVDGEVKVGAGFPDTSDTLAMAKEMIGGELLGQDSREDSDIISREMVMEWTKQMEEASKPPTGIDAEIFGERDSLKRLIFESVSQGAITN